MSPRISRLAAARNQARTITVCAAVIGCAVAPAVAQAASASTAPHAAVAYHRVVTGSTGHTVKAKHHTAAATATTASSTTTSVAVADATSTYTVKSGDTMYGIAQRSLGSGEQYQTLFKMNKGRAESNGQSLTAAADIQVGWTLALPDGTTVAAAPVASSSDSSSSDSGSSSSSSASASASSSSSSDSSSSSAGSASSSSYGDDLNGWINQAVSVLAANGYSVSYNAIYQTAMNESSGNPNAENGWDSNAAAGTPSIGLLQVIQPTFDAYALPGYGDIWNPVDNIIAGAVYAQDTYGGLDNVVDARCGGSCWSGY
ncbi:MAG TPA: transglycosylase SLT domain-containing protein [Actinocrinis sp.]|nr:transglycosylase SLT domain-containing protein [Actinocrinis sp.]